MREARLAISVIILTLLLIPRAWSQDGKEPVTDRQIALLMFVDYGRSYGYQTMMASIQIDVVKSQLERDQELLKRKEALFKRKAIPAIELEIAQLKDVWNRKQLVVAEKSLAVVAAQYKAMAEMAKHFGGLKIPVESLYTQFRSGWDAGCEKGPDEAEAMKAWADYAKRSVERARQLNKTGSETLTSLLEKEAQSKIAQANYEQRNSRLDRCRAVLFPSLADVLAIPR